MPLHMHGCAADSSRPRPAPLMGRTHMQGLTTDKGMNNPGFTLVLRAGMEACQKVIHAKAMPHGIVCRCTRPAR